MAGQSEEHFTLISRRRLIYAVILFIAAGVITVHLGQAKETWWTLQHGIWWWIVIATFFQLVFLLNLSALYNAAYQMFNLQVDLRHLFGLVLSASFISVFIPGGFSGAGLMVYDAFCQGLDTARAVLANIAFFLFDYLAFVVVLFLAFMYLFIWGNLEKYELIAAVILVFLIASVLFLLILLAFRPAVFLSLVHHLARIAGFIPLRVFKRVFALEEKIVEFAGRLSSALKTVSKSRSILFRAVIHALLVEGIGLIQLQALFLAFGQSPGLGRLITGYAIGVLFMIISITPQGVGLMEGAMVAVYTSVGVPPGQAVLVTFVYRALSFWLPMFFGLIFFKRVVAK